MFYLALTFWLMVGLLEAYGIFKLWEALVRPRWIHLVLLPGTVVAEMAHFLAALLTGAPVHQARLVSDEPVIGEVGGDAKAPAKTGIPVLGPLLMALLPILAGVTIIYLLYRNFDRSVVAGFAGPALEPVQTQLTQELTWKLSDWFAMAQNLLTLSHRLIDALHFQDFAEHWKGWLFIYLTACLAVRMVPLRNSLRNGMAVIVMVGALAALVGLIDRVDTAIHDAWALIAYVIALLTTLLIATLLVRGVIALGFVLADRPMPRRNA